MLSKILLVLGCVLVVLKATGMTDWPWWMVLMPFVLDFVISLAGMSYIYFIMNRERNIRRKDNDSFISRMKQAMDEQKRKMKEE